MIDSVTQLPQPIEMTLTSLRIYVYGDLHQIHSYYFVIQDLQYVSRSFQILTNVAIKF